MIVFHSNINQTQMRRSTIEFGSQRIMVTTERLT